MNFLRVDRFMLAPAMPAVFLVWALVSSAFAQTPQPTPAELLRQARSWGYQLQHPDVTTLAASPYDVLVIDYSKEATDELALRPADLEKLRRKPDGSRRVVLAYLSIGEAESYRYYWRWYWGGAWYSNWLGWLFGPSWLGPVNRDWGGNFAVRYWQAGWQQVIVGDGGYLDRIVKAGFDGVWLDKVDSSIERIATGRATAQDDMRAFVKRIAERGRAQRAGFLVVPQNGEELLTDAGYRATIDGIGKEDLLFGEFKEKRANPPDVVAKRLALLNLLTTESKPVLAVEYVDDPQTVAHAQRTLTGYGFIPHFAKRALDKLAVGENQGVSTPAKAGQ